MSGNEDWSWFDDDPPAGTPAGSSQPDARREFHPYARGSSAEPTDAMGDGGWGRADMGVLDAPAPASQDVSAPAVWLFGALAAAVIALVIAGFASGSPALSVAGWAIGGFLAIGLVTLFSYFDSRARANPWYVIKPYVTPVRAAALGLAAIAVAANAYLFADWYSRR